MRHSALVLLAASSLLWPGMARGATRPGYGGILYVELSGTPSSLDPADGSSFDSLETGNVLSLVFDTLVSLDDRGRPEPALAISWQAETGDQRWDFKLRHAVTFHDGTPLTGDSVAASLRIANPKWKVFTSGETVTVELDSPHPNLPAELATWRNGIAKRGDPVISGTGPFVIHQWEAGKRLSLAANDNYWGGRPFLDAIEITLGQSFREQAVSLRLGKADLIEVAPEQVRGTEADGGRVRNSEPSELLALVLKDGQSADQDRLYDALTYSIDRAALVNVLLQGGGRATGRLLPNWMTGYEFLFPHDQNLAKAREQRGGLRQTRPRTLSYSASDPGARVMAERIILNARDAGLEVQLTSTGSPDLQLVKMPLTSLDAGTTLATMANSLGLVSPKLAGSSTQDLYDAETTLLNSKLIIPLLHLRISYGLGARVRNWSTAPNGLWHLDDVWLSTDK